MLFPSISLAKVIEKIPLPFRESSSFVGLEFKRWAFPKCREAGFIDRSKLLKLETAVLQHMQLFVFHIFPWESCTNIFPCFAWCIIWSLWIYFLWQFLWRNGGPKGSAHLIHSIWANFQTSTSNVRYLSLSFVNVNHVLYFCMQIIHTHRLALSLQSL